MNGTLQGVATRKSKRNVAAPAESTSSKLIRIIFLIIFDIGSIWFIRNAISLGFDQLVVVIAVIAVMNTAIFLIPMAYPYRWMAVGLSFMILFVIYPMLFTIYVAFTNYGDGHLLTKEQAIPLIQKTTYLPEIWQVVFMDCVQIPLWRLCALADRPGWQELYRHPRERDRASFRW